MAALDFYSQHTQRGVMIEYIVIAQVNDSLEQARQLGELLSGRHVWINLIPYNPTEVGDKYQYKAPTSDSLQAFRHEVIQFKDHMGKGLVCKVRWSSANGRDVDGACGQLALKNLKLAGAGGSSSNDSTTSTSGVSAAITSSSSGSSGSSGSSSGSSGNVDTSGDIEDIDLAIGARATDAGQEGSVVGTNDKNRSRRRKTESAAVPAKGMAQAKALFSSDQVLMLMAFLGMVLLLLGVWL
jgi:hypothetical protein